MLWYRTLNGTAANGFNVARSVAVDHQGNVIAAGFTQNSSTRRDFSVAKFDRDGILLWQQSLNGTANWDDEAFSVAVDNDGNVVAAGSTSDSRGGFTVAKFDRDGTLLWQQTLNGSVNGYDSARSVAVDNEGNVVAAGSTDNRGSGADFTVAKFDRDGTLLWQQTLNGTANDGDTAFSVAVDNQGNVVAAGSTKNTATVTDLTVAKFDRDGILLWQQNVNAAGFANSVAVDDHGNVVATSSNFRVTKFDRDGPLLWQQTPDGTTATYAVAVDNQGYVVVAGSTRNNGTFNAFMVAKFDR